jgi:hypothetical protein
MLVKCANPSCSASFLRLDEGTLFRLETEPTLGSKAQKIEYFWLCKYCSAGMTLRLGQDGSIVAAGPREAPRDGPHSINRENRQFLRSVSFHRSGRSRAA